MDHQLNRRSFLKTAAAAGSYALVGSVANLRASAQTAPRILPCRRDEVPPATSAFVKTQERAAGVALHVTVLQVAGEHRVECGAGHDPEVTGLGDLGRHPPRRHGDAHAALEDAAVISRLREAGAGIAGSGRRNRL